MAPWLLASGHQLPCRWLWKINQSLSSVLKDFNYLHHRCWQISFMNEYYSTSAWIQSAPNETPRLPAYSDAIGIMECDWSGWHLPWGWEMVIKIDDRKMMGMSSKFNSSPSGQNGHHFADDIFSCIFGIENFHIWIKISLKFVPKGQINNNTALVQIMAWGWIGDKPLSEPMLTWFIFAALGEMS